MKNRNLDHSDNWITPEYIYKPLNKEFRFDFDPCPLDSEFDGLIIDWGESNFVNPPYSRRLKPQFIEKAYEQWRKGKIVVMLLPVCTSTKHFHKYIYPYAELRFIEKRVRFIGYNMKGEKVSQKCGMFDSMIVIFKRDKEI